MPCSCRCEEDGVLAGKPFKINDIYHKPISIVFQTLLKLGKLSGPKVGVEFCGKNLTFDEIEDFSTALSQQLRDRLGNPPAINNPESDVLIATFMPNSEKSIVLILAILKFGAAYLPLDTEYPEELLLKLIKKFQPILLVTDENGSIYNKFDLQNIGEACSLVEINELWNEMVIPSPHEAPTLKARKSSIKPEVMNTFNSKKTGKPIIPPEQCPVAVFHSGGFHDEVEGVRISHLSVINRCIFEWNELSFSSNNSCSLSLQFSQVDSLPQIFSPLLKGSTLHVFRRSDFKNMNQFVKDIANKFVTRLTIPYYYLSTLLHTIESLGKAEAMASLKSVTFLMCSGGLLQPSEILHFFELFQCVPLCNSMGDSSCSGDILYDVFTSARDLKRKCVMGRLTLGRVLHNVKIYVLSQQLQIISDTYQGELCVSGICLALDEDDEKPVTADVGKKKLQLEKRRKKLRNPHEHVGVDEGYGILCQTGVYGRIYQEGGMKRGICVEGKNEQLIKRKGREYHTSDIQPFLKDLDFCKDAYVYGIHRGKPNEEIIGIIVMNKNIKKIPDSKDVEYNLRGKIPEWALPDELMFTSRVPKHYYSAICPRCLIQEFQENRQPKNDAWEDNVPFEGKKKDAAIALITAIFQMTSIPIDIILNHLKQTFYDIGGTSLNFVQVLVQLSKAGFEISIQDFYSKSSLTELINLLVIRAPPTLSLSEMTPTPSVSNSAKGDQPAIKDTSVLRGGTFVAPNLPVMPEVTEEYFVEIMKKHHKRPVIRLLATGYCNKSAYAAINMISYKDLEAFLSSMFNSHLQDQVSLVVIKKSTKTIVAAAICQDFFKIVDTSKANGSLYSVMEFFHEVKGNLLMFLPHRLNETLEIVWMSTHQSLKPWENVKLISFLHLEIIRMAQETYTGVFHPTINPLSRALCTEVFGYEVFEDFQLNKYKDLDGRSQPFHIAGDTVVCGALYVRLRNPNPPSAATSMNVIDPVAYFSSLCRKSISEVKYYHDHEEK